MFTEEKIFASSLILSGAFFLLASVWIYKTNAANISVREKLPRMRILGAVLAGLGLFWCTFHSKPLVPSSMHFYLLPTAAFCTWVGYILLDYLFARAFGGMLILFAHYWLYESFAYKTPCKPLFSILCFVMGTFGIFLCGKPHLLRDLFRNAAKSTNWRYSLAGILVFFSLMYMTYGLIHLLA
ncbi:MAG TPA: hypothetical protein DCZ94_21755 [Lentisphaeria bacterium]|nr:MAG: hypothetical protein A2X48_19400 [Lentisphaerae bacterium GWF2_49_21]HBC89572.1 hypothetical protein [Lentisphaeria bacterium]